ncbi:Protein kinase C and RhoGAP domain containing protein [Aphelenchoides fujianensis]|nr:Protein kinase C and RhoGAP domain containing protein [Aphelenchoides fujianensis]
MSVELPQRPFCRWGSSHSAPSQRKFRVRHVAHAPLCRSSIVQNGRTTVDVLDLLHSEQPHEMRELLVRQDDGLAIAFERCKSWSKYASQLLSFVRTRIRMEEEHARNVSRLAEQTKSMVMADSNNNCLPMIKIFNELMKEAEAQAARTDQMAGTLNQRFVATLENRQKEHDTKRRKLKADWLKQKKQLDSCALRLQQARQSLQSKEGGYMKARDQTIRHVQSVPANGVVDVNRKRKELELRKKKEEDAFNRKADAELEVHRLERELNAHRKAVEDLRLLTIDQLCDSIRGCDLTTSSCFSHYVKAFGELWTWIPGDYERLANEIRREVPSTEFMSFLNSLPGRSLSTASLLRGSSSTGDRDDELHGGVPGSSSESAPSSARRRNALNADEHYDLIAETSHRRQKKTRLFDHSLSNVEQSDAAKTHQLQRTRQVTRCYHCDVYCIFDAVKCTSCGAIFHRKCLAGVSIACGPERATGRRLDRKADGHLEAQQRRIPLILEKCVDEIQSRGMNSKGLYRLCGVKSKIEQICVSFEQSGNEANVDLSDVHPMNLASVVKLYLRKLPECLLTYDLYREFVDFDTQMESRLLIPRLRELCDRLPPQNFDTLRFLMLHLKRVTWFELENLMTASNLSAVISPSLIWPNTYNTGPSTPASFSSAATVSIGPQATFINDAHQQTKVVELLIQHAFEIFDVNREQDAKDFFSKYPEVPRPKPVDALTEMTLNSRLMGNDEDNLSDDFDNSEDEQLDAGSSGAFSQLPPTPDLLRTSKKKAESFG